jgi:zeaxanthin glucosyltransferase
MAEVVILADLEPGHLFPTFRIARMLIEAGYGVCYAGVPNIAKIIAANGFESIAILQNVYPAGHSEKKNADISTGYSFFLSEDIDALIMGLSPRLFISSWALPMESLLLHYKFKIPQIQYHCNFPFIGASKRNFSSVVTNECIRLLLGLPAKVVSRLLDLVRERNIIFSSFRELVDPLADMPRFILCPVKFDLEGLVLCDKDILLGPCIREPLTENQKRVKDIMALAGNRKVIYASMGTQVREYPDKAKKVYRHLLDAMIGLPEFELVLSMGDTLPVASIGPEIPGNVLVMDWIPQVEILPFVSLAVIHGGLGSIKECIYYGVPMLIIPLGRDQADNGARVQHHQAGIYRDPENLQAATLKEDIIQTLQSEIIRSGIKKMQEIFSEEEEKDYAVPFIKSYIGGPRSEERE